MWRVGLSILVLLALSGCCGPSRRSPFRSADFLPARANLALGPSATHSVVAQEFARSDWPSAVLGWPIDEVTYYSTTTYDEDVSFDRYGASFRTAETVRTGVFLR
jgi:hypothetical protein